jgi:hypothetical protein
MVSLELNGVPGIKLSKMHIGSSEFDLSLFGPSFKGATKISTPNSASFHAIHKSPAAARIVHVTDSLNKLP